MFFLDLTVSGAMLKSWPEPRYCGKWLQILFIVFCLGLDKLPVVASRLGIQWFQEHTTSILHVDEAMIAT